MRKTTRTTNVVKLTDADEERLREAYEAYGESARKRRAWAADNPGNARAREELLRRVIQADASAPAGDILDAGCGTGALLAELAARGIPPARLHGLDLLEERAESAASALPEAEILAGDARRLPYEDGRFALVLMVTLLSSMSPEGARAAVREALRALVPHGLLLCYEPRLPNPFNRRTRLVRRRELPGAVAGLGRIEAEEALTLLPAIGRRAGRFPRLHRRLHQILPLLSHRLTYVRRGD